MIVVDLENTRRLTFLSKMADYDTTGFEPIVLLMNMTSYTYNMMNMTIVILVYSS